MRVFGTEVGKLPAHRVAAYRASTLGYADQHYSRALAAELPARQLVALQLGLRGTPRRERSRRADELLERVGLADRRDARPGQLSGASSSGSRSARRSSTGRDCCSPTSPRASSTTRTPTGSTG
ncbi:MAG: hypothetical protein ABR569_00730 [Gaiellaceae bacterium]